jgi:hypothetical protein
MVAPYLYREGLSFAYVKPLLYDLLRIAPKIELFYKLRGAGAGPLHLRSQRIGYSGRTGAYKNLRRRLIREGVLNREGVFIDNGPNLWLARLSEHVEGPQAAAWIGRRIPYMVFLAPVLNEGTYPKSSYQLARDLGMNLTSAYSAVRSLVNRGLIDRPEIAVADGKPARQLQSWLERYLELIIEHANLSHESAKMFRAVPAYIDGPEALQRVKYAAGMPIGPAPMVIRTYKPYWPFWARTLDKVDDFRERERPVSLDLAHRDTRIIWVSGLPYSSKPKLE